MCLVKIKLSHLTFHNWKSNKTCTIFRAKETLLTANSLENLLWLRLHWNYWTMINSKWANKSDSFPNIWTNCKNLQFCSFESLNVKIFIKLDYKSRMNDRMVNMRDNCVLHRELNAFYNYLNELMALIALVIGLFAMRKFIIISVSPKLECNVA